MHEDSHMADRIRSTSQELGNEVRRAGYRLQAARSWRLAYERQPWAFVGAAFAGGLLLAVAVGGYRHRTASYRERYATAAKAAVRSVDDGLATTEVWSRLRDALVAVAGSQIRNFLREVIPRLIDTDRYVPESDYSHREQRSKSGNGHGSSEATSE